MAAVTYDPEADVLYVELAHVKDPGNEGEEGHPGVVLMFDAVGKLTGIESGQRANSLQGMRWLACRTRPKARFHEHLPRRGTGLDRVICATPLGASRDVQLKDLDRFAK